MEAIIERNNVAAIQVNDKTNVVIDDSFSFTELFNVNSKQNVTALRPSVVTEQEQQMANALKVCDEIAALNRKYHTEYVVRGTQALYEVLSAIYKAAIQINLSIAKDQIYKKMRDALKARDIKTQANTPALTVLVKYIVGADRKSASNYSRVLQVAMQENLAPEELAAYISRRGGIGQIHATEVKQQALKTSSDQNKERLSLMREYFLLQQWKMNQNIKFDGDVIRHNALKDTDSETGDFVVFLTVWDDRSDTYRVVSANDLGKTYEDSFLRLLVKDAPNDLGKIKEGIARYKKALLKKGDLPPALDELVRKELTAAGTFVEERPPLITN